MAFRSKRRRLFRKYVVIVVGLVTGAVVSSGAVEAYFAFRDNEASLVQIQREKASAATAAIEQFIGELERDVGTALHPVARSRSTAATRTSSASSTRSRR